MYRTFANSGTWTIFFISKLGSETLQRFINGIKKKLSVKLVRELIRETDKLEPICKTRIFVKNIYFQKLYSNIDKKYYKNNHLNHKINFLLKITSFCLIVNLYFYYKFKQLREVEQYLVHLQYRQIQWHTLIFCA